MSKIRTGPYVNFGGRAREAMELYQKLLGGELDLRAVDQQGKAKAAGPGDRIMHAQLEADDALIIGTDGHPDYPATAGDNWAIALVGADRARLTAIFNGLAEGGKVKGPLTEQGGAEVGWLMDKFGVSWMVSIAKA